MDYPGVDADYGLERGGVLAFLGNDEFEGLYARLTPGGKNLPASSAPPSGTTRAKIWPTAGCRRRASLMVACR